MSGPSVGLVSVDTSVGVSGSVGKCRGRVSECQARAQVQSWYKLDPWHPAARCQTLTPTHPCDDSRAKEMANRARETSCTAGRAARLAYVGSSSRPHRRFSFNGEDYSPDPAARRPGCSASLRGSIKVFILPLSFINGLKCSTPASKRRTPIQTHAAFAPRRLGRPRSRAPRPMLAVHPSTWAAQAARMPARLSLRTRALRRQKTPTPSVNTTA